MDDLIYFSNGQPVAAIAPSTVYAKVSGGLMINGPKGVTVCKGDDEESLGRALAACGSLIPGNSEEISNFHQLLADPTTSRTASYFSCYSTNCADLIEDIKAIRQSHILILGCGGIGSSLCMLLAGAGVQNFTLIDPDLIEPSNLNRQLFWTLNDVGRLKVDVLKDALLARFPSLTIAAHSVKCSINNIDAFLEDSVNGAAITADDPPTLVGEGYKIAEFYSIPVVAGGYIHHVCQSFCFLPGDPITRKPENANKIYWQRLPSSIMPSYGPMNFDLASKLSYELLGSLAKRTLGKTSSSCTRWDSSRQKTDMKEA